jgi:hypothetical protein
MTEMQCIATHFASQKVYMKITSDVRSSSCRNKIKAGATAARFISAHERSHFQFMLDRLCHISIMFTVGLLLFAALHTPVFFLIRS